MKSKLIELVIAGIAVVAIIATVGGWLDNDDGGKENPSNQGGSAPIVETGVDVMPLTEFNTDTPFENLTIEIVEYFGEHMIYKVTNNSNVCYDSLYGDIYFKSDPIKGYEFMQKDEYNDVIRFECIPAYSVTYHLADAFSIDVEKYPNTKTVYYPFDLGVDSYRVELNSSRSEISKELIQSASENVTFNRDGFDSSINKLGTIDNKTNHVLEFSGFVVFENEEVANITNIVDYESRDYQFHGLIPAYQETFKIENYNMGNLGDIVFVGDYVCPAYVVDKETNKIDFEKYDKEKECKLIEYVEIDCNSIYVDRYYNGDTITQDFDIYINAWIANEY